MLSAKMAYDQQMSAGQAVQNQVDFQVYINLHAPGCNSTSPCQWLQTGFSHLRWLKDLWSTWSQFHEKAKVNKHGLRSGCVRMWIHHLKSVLGILYNILKQGSQKSSKVKTVIIYIQNPPVVMPVKCKKKLCTQWCSSIWIRLSFKHKGLPCLTTWWGGIIIWQMIQIYLP